MAKRNQYLNLSLSALLLVITLYSCNKFLDKKNDTTLIQPTSLVDLQQILDDGGTMNMAATPTYGEVSADDYFVPTNVYGNLSSGDQLLYKWLKFDHGGNDWGISYQKVYYSNYCLDQLRNIEKDAKNAERWDNVKGSALFFRSYYFLELLWDYAKSYDSETAGKDLGIALRLTSNFNIPSTRSTVAKCYEQIIGDTKSSIDFLPSIPQYVLRPSKMAAYGLLARCYLTMRDYHEALLYADSALQLNNQLINYNGDNDIKSTIDAKLPFNQFNKELIFYSEMNKGNGLQRTDLKSRIDTALYASYNDKDLRKRAFFLMNAVDGYPVFKGSYSTTLSTLFSGIATDEIYLIRSECYIREDQIQKGLNDLNTLLTHRYQKGSFRPITTMSKDQALNTVLDERRKELVMRGLRWPDIKRLNKENSSITPKRIIDGQTYTLLPNANRYALPIPNDIILATNMSQNPG